LAARKRLLNEAPDWRYFMLTRQVDEAVPRVEQHAAESFLPSLHLGDGAGIQWESYRAQLGIPSGSSDDVRTAKTYRFIVVVRLRLVGASERE
jgi:hypothetical protein